MRSSTSIACALFGFCGLCPAACEESAGSGLASLLEVEGATYVAAPLADVADAGGPAVIETYARTSYVVPGQRGKFFRGTLAPGATAVLLGLDGDHGYFVLPAAAPDTQTPDQPTFQTRLGFAAALVASTATLRVVAADVSGRTGPASTVTWSVLPSQPPTGALVVSLHWDGQADLDLRVVDPSGFEIGPGHIVSRASEPDAGTSAGLYEFDSNANCLIDGRRFENVTWAAPPAGHYLVRVDSYSLCDAAAAHWSLSVIGSGVVWLRGQGVATAPEARFAKGMGGGVLALEFDWPGGV